jgi:hypothetical protein
MIEHCGGGIRKTGAFCDTIKGEILFACIGPTTRRAGDANRIFV